MTQGLVLGGRRILYVAPGRRQVLVHKPGPVQPPAWPGHSWPMTRHFLGLPAGFEVWPRQVAGACGNLLAECTSRGCG